jgi:hypothetical protein
MFSTFSNMLPSLSLPGQDKDQTPTSTTNPFDRLLAVKRRFDGTRTPAAESPTEQPEPQTAPEPEPAPEEQRAEKPKRKLLNEVSASLGRRLR